MPTRTQEVSSEAGPSKQSSPHTSPLKRQSSASMQQLKLPPILPLSDFPETAEPKHPKAAGYDFYRNVLGSPKRIVAPMVSGSEYPWRILSNKLGAELCYSPMINSRSLTDNLRAKGATAREHALAWFNTESGEEGHGDDQKLIVQLAGDDPALILQAAESVQDHCLGIDLNLGCPQHIAKRGHYGAFLQEDWHLIFDIISTLHRNLKVPVTAKMRVFPDVERTVAYAQMLERAGAQIVTCHGRTREQKGHLSGLADWEKIKAVKEALKVPVFANGNVLYREDVDACLETTGVDGVMSAEGNLYNPALFASEPVLDKLPSGLLPHRRGVEGSPEVAVRREWAEFPYIPALAHMYLDEVAKCQHKVDKAAVKGHIFKICRPALAKHPDLRPSIGKAMLAYPGDKRAAKETDSVHEDESLPEGERVVKQYRDIMRELDGRLQADRKNSALYEAPADFVSSSLPGAAVQERYIPHWLAQPYFRPTLPDNGHHDGSNKRKGQGGGNGMLDPKDVQSAGENQVADSATEDGAATKKQMLDTALAHKNCANDLFVKGRYDEAVAEYQDGIAILPPRPNSTAAGEEATSSANQEPDTDSRTARSAQKAPEKQDQIHELSEEELAEEMRLASLSPAQREAEEEAVRFEADIVDLRCTLFSNTAACEIKLERWDRAVTACNEALTDVPDHLKSLHRRSMATEKQATWSSLSQSHADLTSVLNHPDLPTSQRSTTRIALDRVARKRDEAGQREKDEMMGKLKGLGDSLLGHFGLSTDNFKFEQNESGGWGMKFQR